MASTVRALRALARADALSMTLTSGVPIFVVGEESLSNPLAVNLAIHLSGAREPRRKNWFRRQQTTLPVGPVVALLGPGVGGDHAGKYLENYYPSLDGLPCDSLRDLTWEELSRRLIVSKKFNLTAGVGPVEFGAVQLQDALLLRVTELLLERFEFLIIDAGLRNWMSPAGTPLFDNSAFLAACGPQEDSQKALEALGAPLESSGVILGGDPQEAPSGPYPIVGRLSDLSNVRARSAGAIAYYANSSSSPFFEGVLSRPLSARS